MNDAPAAPVLADAPAGPAASAGAILRGGGAPLLLLLVGALALRLYGLSDQLWLDEILTLHDFARAPLSKTVASFPNDNNHPLYSLAASLSVRAFGETAVALRLPAVLFGVASVAALFVLARRFWATAPSLIVAAALAGAGPHVFFSQNARGYTALCLFALVATDGFLRAVAGARGGWTTQAFGLGLGAYSHLTGVFVGVAQALALALVGGPRGRLAAAPWKGIFAGGALAILLHAPMASDLWEFFVAREDRVAVSSAWKDPLHFVREALAPVPGRRGWTMYAVGALGFSAACFAVGGFARLRRRAPAATVSMLLAPVVGATATLAMGRHLWPRFFFFATGFAALIGVSGLFGAVRAAAEKPPKHAAWIALPVLLIVAGLTARSAYGPKQDFEGPMRHLRTEAAVLGKPPQVFTAGLALWPYKYLHAPDWTPVALGPGDLPVDDPSALLAAVDGPERAVVRVVACSPVFLGSRQPQVARVLAERFLAVASYRGTMGSELDVTVYRPK